MKDIREEGNFTCDNANVRVWRGVVEGLDTIFLEPDNGIFWVGTIYGRNDDASRFNYFSNAALAYLNQQPNKPNVVHCHDWQTAPATFGGSCRSVFTIHNLEYKADIVGRAMQACEIATTVSPTYAREIAGNPAVAPNLGKLYGIRNGGFKAASRHCL